MKSIAFARAITAAVIGLGVTASATAEPYRGEYYHHHHRHYEYYARDGHGHCLRFNKTTGTIAGVGVGGLIGNAVVGGTGGLLVGAAAGGLAGHELARNGRKHCR